MNRSVIDNNEFDKLFKNNSFGNCPKKNTFKGVFIPDYDDLPEKLVEIINELI